MMKRTAWIVALALLFWACAAPAETGPLSLGVEVKARGLEPGEPVRIHVRGPEPLRAVAGTFLGQDLYFSAHDDPQHWSAWAMIALDDPAGPTGIEVWGETVGGAEARGTRAVTVVAKEFEEERLSVQSKYVSPPAEVQERLAEERRALAAVYALRTARAYDESPFLRPVPGEQNSFFGTRRVLNGEPRSPHPGVDMRGAEGTPIRSPAAGRVVLVRDLYYSGNTVILDHGGGMFTIYAHLSRIDAELDREIGAGDPIGLVGATGRVTGPHLHWGAKIGNRPFDPMALLNPALFE